MNYLGRTIKRPLSEITDDELVTSISSCSSVPDYSVSILLPAPEEIPRLLDRVYGFLDGVDNLVDVVVNYHKNIVTFKNKSYIQVSSYES